MLANELVVLSANRYKALQMLCERTAQDDHPQLKQVQKLLGHWLRKVLRRHSNP